MLVALREVLVVLQLWSVSLRCDLIVLLEEFIVLRWFGCVAGGIDCVVEMFDCVAEKSSVMVRYGFYKLEKKPSSQAALEFCISSVTGGAGAMEVGVSKYDACGRAGF